MTLEQALRIFRSLVNNGISREAAIENEVIPSELRQQIREHLEQEDSFILQPARMLTAEAGHAEWLHQVDRSMWHYWPSLREHLLSVTGWSMPMVRSLDEITDRILGQLEPPETTQFDVRGLVLGYVQSGKGSMSMSV